MAAITVINVSVQEFPSSRQDRAKSIVSRFCVHLTRQAHDRQFSQNVLDSGLFRE
jgi:hypothetical protein